MQRTIPYLTYEDAPAALEFLAQAFGFVERSRYPMDDGRLGHAETAYEGSSVMLASVWPELGFMPQHALPGRSAQIVVYVDDVDAHCERARTAGATIIAEPRDEPHGARTYRAQDPEGHAWIFMTPPTDSATEAPE